MAPVSLAETTNYPLRSNYPREGFQAARDGNERVFGLYPPHAVGAGCSHGAYRRPGGGRVAHGGRLR